MATEVSYVTDTHVIYTDEKATNVLVTLTRETITTPEPGVVVTKTEHIQAWDLKVTEDQL